MASVKPDLAPPPFRPLSKQQIDRRIERLVGELARAGTEDRGEEGASEALRPHAISPAELIRRLRPFMSRN